MSAYGQAGDFYGVEEDFLFRRDDFGFAFSDAGSVVPFDPGVKARNASRRFFGQPNLGCQLVADVRDKPSS